ncbi:GUN4 domain-containing protein [Synechococcus sp. Cruz-9H2]|uniref:GUN4 domain-containing protein n=1 Tax=unclassified Synechococcus TaxID=2626047 RepID=UPI0020CE43AF|nr:MULTISPECIES: GUN4 domain-containing protein [unclassified Synechococcus]MCP9820557.1 GUN4 domain-containing protein [Synechococcus sp. Cruz-9H2]MCP9844806.1 GUN4 domain-containing protein [Synechococcus sp. Edmonson 11F2]MCP9856913.1 GUN4 domain-containing protein [Synechococcus sp. Cruz-9C9]MCP9864199.1 GUN4 domain-containing protein [Synechococcus sp. Cruz-7E5]MCP9871483.1 GUN4 domain-containing protein [Synechococcus sp. Cruz-7B9]
MSDLEGRLEELAQRVAHLGAQLEEVQQTLRLVGDVQRFSRLRELLNAGDLNAADQETARLLMEELAGSGGELSPEALERCPAGPLQIIDALWQSSSSGRQGFAVQQRLYRDLGGSRDTLIAQDQELFLRFTQRVGWPLVEGVGFGMPEQEDLSVPVATAVDAEGVVLEGHMPLRCWATDYGLKAANLLMARLIDVFAA